ncbi:MULTISPECIES: dienelactone hydrolase family protein [unclassified Sphingomonas]|uniref:dienelactone hydrolase family protein n=1 Tax=Novosphingobium rhizosphaerae TaxID=1551649 RepID=UPI0015C6C1F3
MVAEAEPVIDRITLTSAYDGFRLSAWHLAARSTRRGGVVVLHEVFGLTPHMADVMQRLAAQGYDVVAPSLFDRIEPGFLRSNAQEGIAAARATPNAQALGDMHAAFARLGEGPHFAVGFCFGGVMAWIAAQHLDGLAGAVSFYGRRIIEELQAPLQCPVQMHYGDRDGSIPLSDVAQVAARYPAAAIHVYPAGHAFCREGGSNFNPAARDLAFQRTLAFMAGLAR